MLRQLVSASCSSGRFSVWVDVGCLRGMTVGWRFAVQLALGFNGKHASAAQMLYELPSRLQLPHRPLWLFTQVTQAHSMPVAVFSPGPSTSNLQSVQRN